MYILGTDDYKKNARIYIFITMFVFIFSYIYEIFSHDVYSLYMMLSPLIPLILGVLVNYILYFINTNLKISNLNSNIHNSIVIALTLYCILNGVLEIFGTTNSLVYLYIYISILLAILNVILFIKNRK